MANNSILKSLKTDILFNASFFISVYLPASVSFLSAQPPSGYALCADQHAIKMRLKTAISQIQTVDAAFRQEKENPLLVKSQTAEGFFYFERPDKVRWEYRNPHNAVLILNGKRIRSLENGADKPLQAGTQRLMAGLTAGILRTVGTGLLENPEYEHQFWCNPAGIPLVRLLPREARMKRYIREIHLYFSREGDRVVRLDMLENPEGVTRLFFENQKLNQNLPAKLFQ
jgi:outer membrane lipoprotein-sorting protein